ncbi:hypothetical protein P9112_000082 [Eukaryota sp. TZLM1-RC]
MYSPSIDDFLALERRLEADLAMEGTLSSTMNIDDFLKEGSSVADSKPSSQKPTPSFTPSSSSTSKLGSPRKSLYSSGHNQSHHPCDSCSREQAVVFCQRCDGSLCSSCDASIHPSSNPLMSRHLRVDLSTFDRRPLACPVHEDEVVSYFCLDCEVEAFCAECAIHGDHKGHNVQKLSKSRPLISKKVDTLVEEMRRKVVALEEISNGISKVKKQLDQKTEESVSLIRSKFDDLRNLIDKKESQLITSVESDSSELMGKLEQQSNDVFDFKSQIDSSRDLIQSKLDNPCDLVLLNFYAEHRDSLYELLSRNDVSEAQLYSSLSLNVDVSTVEKLIKGFEAVKLAVEKS